MIYLIRMNLVLDLDMYICVTCWYVSTVESRNHSYQVQKLANVRQFDVYFFTFLKKINFCFLEFIVSTIVKNVIINFRTRLACIKIVFIS